MECLQSLQKSFATVGRAARSNNLELYARWQIDADARSLQNQSRLANTNVAIAIRAKMLPVSWEKDLAPRPALVSAKTHDLMALHRTAVLLVAAFVIIEVVARGEIANEHCSAD